MARLARLIFVSTRRAVAAATLLVALLVAGDRLDPVGAGLNGTYYANASWSDPPAASTLDPQPSDDRVRDAWHDAPPREFSATWAGSFLAMHDGPYALATMSDAGSWVYVDGHPRLDRFNTAEITSVRRLRQFRPSYYVLNADYGRAEPADTEIGQLIGGLQNGNLGYSLVFRYREPAPWPWLPGAPRDLVGGRKERPITSALRHINPWYEVFSRSR